MSNVDTADRHAGAAAGGVRRLRTRLPPAGDLAEDVPPDMPHARTPLMAAAEFGNEAMVELLLLFGADPARRDAEGRTAADYARAGGHPHLAARLDTVVDKENTIW